MDLPKKRIAIVENKTQLTPKVAELVLKHNEPMRFAPGQFINLNPQPNKYRAYSIASSTSDENKIILLAENGHDGIGANYIKSLKVGDVVEFIGPSGRFKLTEPASEHLYFFATGTGIAPFIPMFYKLAEQNYQGKIEVLLGYRRIQDKLYINKIEEFKNKLPDFNYKIYISQPEEEYDGLRGHITEELLNITNFNAHFYVCGHPMMVEECLEELKEMGVSKDNIFIEEFTHAANN